MKDRINDDRQYKETEIRLYRYKTLCMRINSHKHDITELEDMNPDALMHSSKSFVSMIRGGMRIDPTDAYEKQIAMLRAYISADEYEVRQVRRALRLVRKDPYYMTIECKYFKRMTDEESSRVLKCSISTLRRNRTRLLRQISDALYGMGMHTPQ